MIDLPLMLPSTDGIDPTNPAAMMQLIQSAFASMRKWARLMGEQSNDPRYIVMPNGKTLAQNQGQLYERGQLILFHGTWAAATRFKNKIGGVFADGRFGSPQIHPSPSDRTTLQRYMLAAAWGSASGTTGGASTHTHVYTGPDAHANITITDHSVDYSTAVSDHNASSIDDHSLQHSHPVDIQTGYESSTTEVQSGTGSIVAGCCHTHQACGDTGDGLTGSEGAHSGTLAHSGTSTLQHAITQDLSHTGGSVAAASADVPYCTVIVIMKV